jgi:O-antigen ligase
VLALPASIYLASWWRHWLPRVVIIASSVLQLVAIYIGGYRSIWFVLCIQVAVFCVLRVKKHGIAVAVLVLVVGTFGYQFIPNTHERLVTGIAALQGNPIDHSAQDRKERALQAVSDVIGSPFGKGWSSAGWVHSDFLQVAVNLGVLAGLVFLGGYLFTLLKIIQRMPTWRKSAPQGELGLFLLLSFLAVGSLLAMQGVQVLPQMVLPVWFVWSMVDTWLRQTAEVREPSYSYAPANLYPAANFQ